LALDGTWEIKPILILFPGLKHFRIWNDTSTEGISSEAGSTYGFSEGPATPNRPGTLEKAVKQNQKPEKTPLPLLHPSVVLQLCAGFFTLPWMHLQKGAASSSMLFTWRCQGYTSRFVHELENIYGET
jgi:hypothetical protein